MNFLPFFVWNTSTWSGKAWISGSLKSLNVQRIVYYSWKAHTCNEEDRKASTRRQIRSKLKCVKQPFDLFCGIICQCKYVPQHLLQLDLQFRIQNKRLKWVWEVEIWESRIFSQPERWSFLETCINSCDSQTIITVNYVNIANNFQIKCHNTH